MLGSLQLTVFNELKKRNKVTVYKNEDFSVSGTVISSPEQRWILWVPYGCAHAKTQFAHMKWYVFQIQSHWVNTVMT